jgi:environmental stress-induced protein Ves
VADIERDGPFSAWPGVQRWFQVLQGEGVELDFAGQPRRLTPDAPPLAFDGTAAPGCRLLGGTTRDLNLMLRRGSGGLHPASAGQPACAVALFAAEPAVCVAADGRRTPVPALALLWWGHAPPPTLHGEARAWWIAYHPGDDA